jgi:hypothetical protein
LNPTVRKILLIVAAFVAAVVLFNLLNIILGHLAPAQGATITGPQVITGDPAPTPTRHWCRHHPHHCKAVVKHTHYHHLKLDGHRVSAKGKVAGPNHLRALIRSAGSSSVGCPSGSIGEQHHFHKQYGGGGFYKTSSGTLEPEPLFTEWRQYLTVLWCFNGRHITRHYANAGIDHIFWNENLQGSVITSKWYPWSNNFVRHNGRFEGIDSIVHDCLFFFGWTCIIENHPMLHVHEHADGSFTYNSRRF